MVSDNLARHRAADNAMRADAADTRIARAIDALAINRADNGESSRLHLALTVDAVLRAGRQARKDHQAGEKSSLEIHASYLFCGNKKSTHR